MLTFTVKTNVDQVMRGLEGKLRQQIPFATAKALTQTAKDVQRAETTEIGKVFDRPTPFTRSAVGIVPANKQTLSARVFLKDIQAAYLQLQVTGGPRFPKRRALVLPGSGLRLNQYGNIPRNKLKALLARADVFSGTVRGTAGLWQRMRNGPPKLLIAYQPKAQYRKRLPFYEVAKAEIERRIVANTQAALVFALRSAR